jgi:hypothetical protein
MGLFKDMSSLMKQANEMPRPSMREGIKQANEAMQVYGDTARLTQIGLRGRATIHSITDTGATINDNPIVEMSMTVVMDGGGSYDCTVKQPIQRLQVGLIQPGRNLPVLVDPQDRERLVIDPNAPAEMVQQMSAGAMAQAQAGVPQQDASSRLERLAGLKAQGLITDSEFEAQRARILADI